MTKEQLELNWNRTAKDLSDENLVWIFNQSQAITKQDQMILKEVVSKIVFGEIIKRGLCIALAK